MSYNDERIDFDELEKREMKKVLPIFRMTKAWFITAITIYLLSLFWPIATVLFGGFLIGGEAGNMVVSAAVIAIIINVVIISFLWKCYNNGNTKIIIVLYVFELLYSIWQQNWLSLAFFVWIGLSFYFTSKARDKAQRAYNDLDAARRYSQERQDRQRMLNQTPVNDNPDLINQPIDNSNIFASSKPKNPDEDIELISMENVFAKPKGAETVTPEPYTVSPMASFNTAPAEETPAASPFAPLSGAAAATEDTPDAVEGFKGIRYCPKCSFSLLPGETKCSRCN